MSQSEGVATPEGSLEVERKKEREVSGRERERDREERKDGRTGGKGREKKRKRFSWSRGEAVRERLDLILVPEAAKPRDSVQSTALVQSLSW